MCGVSLYAYCLDFIDDRILTRARVRVIFDRSAGSIRKKEDSNSCISRGSNKLNDAGNRNCVVRLVEINQFLVGEWALERYLKFDVADGSFINIENDGWRELFCMLLFWHRAPGLVRDESG